MKMTRYKASELPALTSEQRDNLQRLAALSEDNINLSDIPEITDWSEAVRGSIVADKSIEYKNLVKHNIVVQFQDRAKAAGKDYQEMINDVLEDYLSDH